MYIQYKIQYLWICYLYSCILVYFCICLLYSIWAVLAGFTVIVMYEIWTPQLIFIQIQIKIQRQVPIHKYLYFILIKVKLTVSQDFWPHLFHDSNASGALIRCIFAYVFVFAEIFAIEKNSMVLVSLLDDTDSDMSGSSVSLTTQSQAWRWHYHEVKNVFSKFF